MPQDCLTITSHPLTAPPQDTATARQTASPCPTTPTPLTTSREGPITPLTTSMESLSTPLTTNRGLKRTNSEGQPEKLQKLG